jgi:hypothetical protein
MLQQPTLGGVVCFFWANTHLGRQEFLLNNGVLIMYVTNSEIFPEDMRQLLLCSEEIMISGRPLTHHTAQGKEFFYTDCQPVIAMRFIVELAIIQTVPDVGHRHIPEDFRGTYPIIIGCCPDTGDEYRFGVRNVLNFYASAQ